MLHTRAVRLVTVVFRENFLELNIAQVQKASLSTLLQSTDKERKFLLLLLLYFLSRDGWSFYKEAQSISSKSRDTTVVSNLECDRFSFFRHIACLVLAIHGHGGQVCHMQQPFVWLHLPYLYPTKPSKTSRFVGHLSCTMHGSLCNTLGMNINGGYRTTSKFYYIYISYLKFWQSFSNISGI
jgi:hypothetical protein